MLTALPSTMGSPMPQPGAMMPPQQSAQIISIGGMQAVPLAHMLDEEKRLAQENQATQVVQSLAAYVRSAWSTARFSKQQTVLQRLVQNERARRGVYDPEKLQAIQAMGGSDVYCGLTSVKCRAAAGWIKDVVLAAGSDKPWTIRSTPVPELPPEETDAILTTVTGALEQEFMMTGALPTPDEVMDVMRHLKDRAMAKVRERATLAAQRMEDKMEDQLVEGGFRKALTEFVDDLATFPAAFLKGPIVRNVAQLVWEKTANGPKPVVKRKPKLFWERVSPFNIYPSPQASTVQDGFLIERHQLSRADLSDMIGVEGYDDGAIKLVLDEYGRGGLREWLWEDTVQASAEGKNPLYTVENRDNLIDAIQYWGSVQGKLLREFGMKEDVITDELKEYNCEIWLIGGYVIKAVLNGNPFGTKPYYRASYEEVPGVFWGNSPADLVRDPQVVVNAAARALVNNMGLASGPQVGVNVDRLPPGENISQLRPWRIWQYTSDPTGAAGGSKPLEFFQPNSNVAELSGIIKMFMDLADEWSGIPKYLTGDAPGGAGRTASGLSMLMGNAGKSLKQVLSNIDNSVLERLLQDLYMWNMMYGEDPDLKGDIAIVVRGANALVAKDATQVRRNEFLMSTANPVDMAIIGPQGRSAVLREVARGLDMDTDKIVPPDDVLKLKLMGPPPPPPGAQPGSPPAPPGGAQLMDGAPVVNSFQAT